MRRAHFLASLAGMLASSTLPSVLVRGASAETGTLSVAPVLPPLFDAARARRIMERYARTVPEWMHGGGDGWRILLPTTPPHPLDYATVVDGFAGGYWEQRRGAAEAIADARRQLVPFADHLCQHRQRPLIVMDGVPSYGGGPNLAVVLYCEDCAVTDEDLDEHSRIIGINPFLGGLLDVMGGPRYVWRVKGLVLS